MPVDNSLIRNTVLIVQHLEERGVVPLNIHKLEGTYFENLRERLDDTRVFVTIHLNNVYEGHLCLCSGTEWFEDGREFLSDNYEKRRVWLGKSTYTDFTQSQALDLVRAGAPID